MPKLSARKHPLNPALVELLDENGGVLSNVYCVPGTVRSSATQIECMARIVIDRGVKEHENRVTEEKDLPSGVQQKQDSPSQGTDSSGVRKTKRKAKASAKEEHISE